jgi:uncharacterized membrane protein
LAGGLAKGDEKKVDEEQIKRSEGEPDRKPEGSPETEGCSKNNLPEPPESGSEPGMGEMSLQSMIPPLLPFPWPIPHDLQAAAALSILTILFTLVEPLSGLPVRVPLGLVMVLFVPGYALIAALFPKKDDLDGIERVALSFGLSIAVVPLIGLGLNYTPFGIRLTPIVISLAAFTLIMVLAAHYRRGWIAPEGRFVVPFRTSVQSMKQEMMQSHASKIDKALTVLLVLSILLSIAALVYVIVTPKQGEKFTEFYILGPGGKAYDYPTKVGLHQDSMVIVGVVNHEYSLVNYTMNVSVENRTLVERRMSLQHNETWEQPITYRLLHLGNFQRVQFYLFKEDNFTAPYRDLHLWVNVTLGQPRNLALS